MAVAARHQPPLERVPPRPLDRDALARVAPQLVAIEDLDPAAPVSSSQRARRSAAVWNRAHNADCASWPIAN